MAKRYVDTLLEQAGALTQELTPDISEAALYLLAGQLIIMVIRLSTLLSVYAERARDG